MAQMTLGKTRITVNKNGFGALPIQRITKDEAAHLLRKAYQSGITFFDTARFYTDSEEKIGYALSDVRDKIIIATKTMPMSVAQYWEHLHTSLTLLKTDHIDIYQFHNPSAVPKPGDGTGLYEAMLEAKTQGKVRHIGITNHRLGLAIEAAESGLYETIQYPFSYLAAEKELNFVSLCRGKNIAVIAMKALSGGLITNSAAAYAFMSQFDNVLPIWGVQREKELDEFLSYDKNPSALTGEMRAVIEKDKKELGGSFCRGCGYCLPCPQNIDIPSCARMSLMIRRAPVSTWTSPQWQANMQRIEECIHCDHCKNHCPYGLDTPTLLSENLADYQAFLSQ
jgi:aryl-alcohol dehydrogenase-like predicted oxidoreductase